MATRLCACVLIAAAVGCGGQRTAESDGGTDAPDDGPGILCSGGLGPVDAEPETGAARCPPGLICSRQCGVFYVCCTPGPCCYVPDR
jgi:hypothetical protein